MAYTDPGVVSGGGAITAAHTNLYRTAIQELQVQVPLTATTWSSPIAGGITVGSGATVAVYTQEGVWVTAYFKFTYGAGSAVPGPVQLTLPVAAVNQRMVCSAVFLDDSASTNYPGCGLLGASTTVLNVQNFVSPITNLSATVPFTWAANDIITVGPFTYRVL